MSKDQETPQGCLKRLLAQIGAVLSGAYLLNIGYGIVDLIPDNLPVAGNLDEVIASLILFVCLDALGIGPQRLFRRKTSFKMGSKEKNVKIQDAEIVEAPEKENSPNTDKQ